MSRQIYQQMGLIIALVITSVSLPIGIIGLTREPLVPTTIMKSLLQLSVMKFYI